jgi:hypothetical protein
MRLNVTCIRTLAVWFCLKVFRWIFLFRAVSRTFQTHGMQNITFISVDNTLQVTADRNCHKCVAVGVVIGKSYGSPYTQVKSWLLPQKIRFCA